MSLEVKSDIPFSENTFDSKFDFFEVGNPLEENVIIQHHFLSKGKITKTSWSRNLYVRPPWAITEEEDSVIYEWIKPEAPYNNYRQTAVTDREHTRLDIYNDEEMKDKFLDGGLKSLTMFPTDQILLGRLLAYRDGCIMHSLGIILDGKGYLFVGHSDAGKSTMARMLMKEATILCDDRNIIRKNGEGYLLSGTWSHGDVPNVSSEVAPLKAIFFLEQAVDNAIESIADEAEKFQALLACLIRPLETYDWWEKSLDLLAMISGDIPCWQMKFNKDGKILDLIKSI